MGVIEVLKKGFEVANNNARLMLIVFVASLVLSPLFLSLQSWMNKIMPVEIGRPLEAPPEGSGIPLLLLIALILLTVFIQGGTLGIARDAVKGDGEATFIRFLNYCRGFMGRLLAYVIIIAAALFSLTLIIVLIFFLPGDSSALAVRNFFLALLISGVVVGIVLFFFSPYILVADDLKTLESMNRSFQFTREHLWPAALFMLLLLLIYLLFLVIIGLVAFLLRSLLKDTWAYTLIEVIITNAATSYLTIVSSVAAMTFYLSRSPSTEEKVKPTPGGLGG
jgi:hypothetical protein